MLRKAEEKDIDRLNALLYQVAKIHADGRPDIFKHAEKKYTTEELGDILADENTPVYVYTDEKDIVLGYCFCVVKISAEGHVLQARKSLYIDDLCVDEVYRGQHIGEALYHYVRGIAKEKGFDSVTLNVWDFNETARKFYEKMGMLPLKTIMEDRL